MCLVLSLSFGTGVYAKHAQELAEGDAIEEHGGGQAVTNQLEDVGYMAKLYDSSNGLPTSDANCIMSSSDGYVYIGGYSGIIRYDGNNFERLDSTDGLTSGRVIYEDVQHRIWVGTNDNGVVVLDGDNTRRYTYEDGLASSSIRSIIQGKDGQIYIGSTAGIAYVDLADELHVLDDERINNQTINRMVRDANGIVYGNTKDGDMFSIRAGEITSFYTSEELGLELVSTICADPDRPGMVYLGTDTEHAYYGRFGSRATEMRKISVDPATAVYYIEYACGRIWITTENVAGYLDEAFNFNVIKNVPMNNSIDMVTADYQGNLWFASSRQGVMKIVASNFRDVTQESGLEMSTVNTTCLYKGCLYIGTDSGLVVLDKDVKPAISELKYFLGDTRIRCITKDDMDNLWVSTYTNDAGLVCMSPTGVITRYTTEEGMPDNRVRGSMVASDGSLLVGTNGGLAVIKNGKVVRTVGAGDVIKNTAFLTICEGDNGVIYAGSDGDGIYAIGENSVARIGRDEGITSDVILKMKKDEKHGVYWIITSNSIEYMKNSGEIVNVDTFPYNNNFDIFADSNNNMWVLSSRGIYCLNAQDMIDNKVTDYKLYTMANGLPGAPTSNSFSELDSEGNLYVSERTGVFKVNIDHFYEQESDIMTDVKSIYCDDEKIAPDEDGIFRIPAVKGRIQINPAVLDYSMTNPLVHIFLDGADEQGITCEQSDLTSLEYTNLKYGSYTLHIQILDKTSKEVLQDDAFRVIKSPRVTELLLVRILMVLFVAAFAGFLVWRVMRSTVISRQYDEIRQARDEAERANTAKTRFLANMSHEIRTPINTIMGMNEMVMREDPTGVPKSYFISMMNYAFDIRNASESLLGLINDLLDMSKIESGKMHLVEQEYDIQDMLRSVVSMIRVRSIEKDLTFDVVVDEMIPKRLYGDVGKIKQVILNLLTNAVKYTEMGGFVLNVTMTERDNDDCRMQFSVEDTGIGVKEEDMDKLFTAYERLDEEKNSGIQGTGLGLDISRRFAELMRGTLECKSVYGEGSEFILDIPQKIIDANPIGVFVEHDDGNAKGPYVPKFIAPDADILVVDDNPMNLNVIKGLLKATKVFVTTASSGEEALDKIRDTKFNVVLLDHMMPGMDGIETMAEIRKFDTDLPVYALTANATAEEGFYESKGFNGYLAKPVDSATLEKTIMKHLPEEMMEQPDAGFEAEELTEIPENMQWINEAQGIDPDEGIKNSGGVSNFIFSLNMFLDTIDDTAKVIKDAYDSNNIRLYTIKVHALKSSARIIGAMELSELCQQLENAVNAGDMLFIDSNAERMMADYIAYKEILAPLRSCEVGDEDKEMIPEDELKDAYSALKDVIPQMDYDSVELILDQLKEYKLPDEDAAKMYELGKMLKSFDWDGMEALIGE